MLAKGHVKLNLSAKPAATPAAVQGSGPYTPSQIRSAYSLTGNFQTASGSAIVGDGSGQTIGIVDAYYDPNVLNDLKTFDAQFGLPNTDASGQSVLTQATYGSTTNAGWGLETDLDVEWAHAIAPEGPHPSCRGSIIQQRESADGGELRPQPGARASSR